MAVSTRRVEAAVEVADQGVRPREYSCGLDAALAIIGGKWKFLILWSLAGQTRRFGALRREVVGISERMLIAGLKEMELDGIIVRNDFGENPPRVEYSLTPFGAELMEALRPLCEFGTRHLDQIANLPTQLHRPSRPSYPQR